MAIGLLIMELSHHKGTVELVSLTYGRINAFVERHQLGAEWFAGYAGMSFFVVLDEKAFRVNVTNLDPEKEDDGRVQIDAMALR